MKKIEDAELLEFMELGTEDKAITIIAKVNVGQRQKAKMITDPILGRPHLSAPGPYDAKQNMGAFDRLLKQLKVKDFKRLDTGYAFVVDVNPKQLIEISASNLTQSISPNQHHFIN
ncbi:MAG TPA: hypothetical protein DCR93_07730 [Cytophagales bacterium]|nr:hypothetical protein [Cytophagales bacterium]HAP59380.1 hypothetical protein [Cytophagales bacterium]